MKNIFKKQETKNNTEFAGMNSNNILKEIKEGTGNKNVLTAATMSEKSKNALEMIKNISTSEASKYLDGTVLSEIAIKYSEGNDNAVEQLLKSHIGKNHGNVEKEYWFMLLDLYHKQDRQPEFEQVAIKYATNNHCSPPSWSKKDMHSMNNNLLQNIIILQQLTASEKDELKEFLNIAKKQKYCRIDVSKLKFENSTAQGVQLFLNLMYELRKHKVISLILQDNIITNFCQQYMKLPGKNQPKKLDPNFLGHEKTLWFLYLEVLQWKNRAQEFEDIALAYADFYEESPPGWDDNGAMKVEANINSQNMNNIEQTLFDKEINSVNLQKIIDFINNYKDNIISVKFDDVERMDFTSATMLSDFLQQYKEKHNQNKIVFKKPNQFLITLFSLLDIDELIAIEAKKY